MVKRMYVWDRFVRVFHWTLVALSATGDESERLYASAGYGILFLVVGRIVWGFADSPQARFRAFVRGPAAVVDYCRHLLSGKPRLYLGHRPAARRMVAALLIALLTTGFTGLKLYGLDGHGPLAPNAQ